MSETLNEIMPWGLTLAQTLFLGGVLLLLLIAWTILQLVFKIGKALFSLGLTLLLMMGCCGAVAFAIYNFA